MYMEYKTFDCNAYKIHTIKTDRFKSSLISVVFRDNIEDDNQMTNLGILGACLAENNKTYKTKRELAIKKEELYSIYLGHEVNRLGKSVEFSFDTEFINPEYINEDNYLDECLKFYFDMLLNPNVTNEEFDLKTYNLVKDRTLQNIERIHESPVKQTLRNAFSKAFEGSNLANYMTKEKVEKTSPTKLYKYYKELINKANCEIYLIGNLDMEEIVSKIKELFDIRSIKTKDIDLYEEHPIRKKVLEISDVDSYVQSNLLVGYNIDSLTPKEKISIRFFLEIFCGGMNSKLTQNLREKNSLCYGVRHMYYKYDRLLLIHVSLDDSNTDKAIKLIKSSMKEMIDGNISEEEFNRAKKSLQFSFKMTRDDSGSILLNYMFHNLGEVPLLEDYEDAINDITIEDVKEVSKKFRMNFTYLLGKGDKNEKN